MNNDARIFGDSAGRHVQLWLVRGQQQECCRRRRSRKCRCRRHASLADLTFSKDQKRHAQVGGEGRMRPVRLIGRLGEEMLMMLRA